MGESFPMTGGDGAYSYTKNSQFQKQASDSVKGMIQEAVIEKLDPEILLPIFRLADFGCSIGPNTFLAMQNAIEAVENKLSIQAIEAKNMEFQVFFNDHVENDFNTLFASLPLDRKYHAAGVPGSFHGRLFPRASISLAYSSYALMWLSKVPEGLSDRKSPAWNHGRIHYTGSSRDVVNAYSDQFERDIGVFLSARAEEIVRGGLMLLIVPGTPEGVSHSEFRGGVYFNLLGSSLMDLANEGVVDKSEIDAFNLPIYFPSDGEMKKVIEKNGYFSIERMEVTSLKSKLKADSRIRHLRAIMEGTFTKHFEDSVVEKMFAKAVAKAENVRSHDPTQLFVVLKRI